MTLRMRRLRFLVAGLVLTAGMAGCASSGGSLPHRPGPGTLHAGSPLLNRSLSESDAWLRYYLMRGEYDAALNVLRTSAARPRDRLLRSLQEGVVLHYAGHYTESNRAFEWAEQEADRRYTKSMRRGAGSLLINDRVLAYTPSVGELALIPYFRMLNYLALGTPGGAAVEARKSSAFLARQHSRKQDPCDSFGLVQYLAGLVYGAAGERNDALVSLRHAEHSFVACSARSSRPLPHELGVDLFRAASALGVQEVIDSVAERYELTRDEPAADSAGDLVVLVEYGFAAHRVQQDLYVPIFADELDETGSGSASAIDLAGRVTSRLVAGLATSSLANPLWESDSWNPTLQLRSETSAYHSRRVEYVLRLAWPVMRLEASRPATARLVVDGTSTEASALEDLSARRVRDLESERPAILARMVARGVLKYTASRGAEEKAEKEGLKWLGALIGLFGNAAANALEQADTRTWSLLPDQISMAKVRVPAGERHVRLELLAADGRTTEIVDLGIVTVRPGESVFLSRRVWGAEGGDRERLIKPHTDTHRRAFGTSIHPVEYPR
ncbi:hypothetical protein BH23GEM3_BH23GEM3_20310 [soil metagenome]